MKFKGTINSRNIALKYSLYLSILLTHLLQKVNSSKSTDITTYAKYFVGIGFIKC